MGIIGGTLGYRILKRIRPANSVEASAYENRSKLEALLGKEIWSEIADRTVIDFGCGTGESAIEMAQRGANKVIGIDIQERLLEIARKQAECAGVSDRCEFTSSTDKRADVIIALDSFEHFENPSAILDQMRMLLKPSGCVLAAFGPMWYHPLGGHLFSVFPWAHLIFTERALIRWRSDFKSDGATRFSEVEGGLNQLTIRRFEQIVSASPFRFARFDPVPISKLRWLATRFTREITTAVVKCKLIARETAAVTFGLGDW